VGDEKKKRLQQGGSGRGGVRRVSHVGGLAAAGGLAGSFFFERAGRLGGVPVWLVEMGPWV
jgi:hypothetical protein